MKKHRLKEIEIEGFRIYADKKRINFFKNITVVYGRNGRGKTTLQDAIGWLFNNDIPRYAEYNREWSRVKNSHIRSLLKPDVSTSITAYLEDVETLKQDKITRTEDNLECSNPNFYKWFENKKQKDLLWSNSLTQAKLQELALAKGRDRLEILAPLLDLTEINQKIKYIEEAIKNQREILKSKEANLNSVSSREGKEQFKLLDEIRDTAREITKASAFLNEIPYPSFNNDEISINDINEWEVWCDTSLVKISTEQSKIENKINLINGKYYEINTIYSEDNIKLEEMEEILSEKVGEINTKKILVKDLKRKKEFIEKNLIIVEESHVKTTSLNLSKNKLKSNIKKLEMDYENLLKDSSSVKGLELKIFNFKNKLKEIDMKYESLLVTRTEMEKHYKNFILTSEDLTKDEKELTELSNWLIENSRTRINEEIKLLESRLIGMGDDIENLVNKNIELEKSFDTLQIYVSDESCPLCGKLHESVGELEIAMLHQKKTWENKFLKHQKEIKEITNELTRLRTLNITVEEKERVIKELRKKSENKKNVMLEIEKNLAEIKKNIGLNINLHTFHKEVFKEILEKIDLKIYQNIDKKSQVINELSKKELDLENNLNVIRLNKNKYDQSLAEYNLIEKEVEEEFRLVKSLFSSDNSLNDFNNLEELIEILKGRIDLLDNDITIAENYSLNAAMVEEIEKKIYFKYKNRLEELNNGIDKIRILGTYLEVLNENLRIVNTSSVLTKEIKKIEIEIEDLKIVKKDLREEQRQATNKEIGKISNRISKIYEMLSDVSPWRTILPDAIVPDERERTNLVFRPVPQKLNSATLEEYLEKTNPNSTFAFSGGQLSLLGLSIFLSQVADEGKRIIDAPIFETLFLDDPIQMLDTLRDDALVALICDIARERQVIISTSDINFANKMMLSSRPMWKDDKESCGVIYYEQLNENGPIVSEIKSQEWIESQRIYIPRIKEAK